MQLIVMGGKITVTMWMKSRSLIIHSYVDRPFLRSNLIPQLVNKVKQVGKLHSVNLTDVDAFVLDQNQSAFWGISIHLIIPKHSLIRGDP